MCPEIAKIGSLGTALDFLIVMWDGSMAFNVS